MLSVPSLRRGRRAASTGRTMSKVDMTVLAKKEYPSVLRNKHFRRLCAAQFISLVATYAIYFASMALVEEITHSSAQMGLMIFSSTLPGLLFGLLAGVVVDRYERVKVMMGANIMRALVALAFTAAVYFFPHIYLLLTIYLTNFCLSALAQFVISAEGATIPYLVGEKRLMAANSVFNVSSLASQGAGLIVLAPLLLKLSGAEAVGLVGVILYLAAFIVVIRLPRENKVRKPGQGRRLAEIWVELKEGWRFISSDRLVTLATLQLTFTSMLTLMLSTLAPGFVDRVLGIEIADAVYMAVPVG
ncbi:MAG TPA: MFS transporter, partial [Chloroflexi bacterium]|nr:MFS transporter [Chloroflexota bacterium]